MPPSRCHRSVIKPAGDGRAALLAFGDSNSRPAQPAVEPVSGNPMNAIKAIRKQMERNPGAPSSKALARLVAALAEEKSYPLADLYAMDYDTFEMAMELLRDWRLDRYYAARLKLFDFALNAVIPDEGTTAGASASGGSSQEPGADRS
jgi:hypothetical protein